MSSEKFIQDAVIFGKGNKADRDYWIENLNGIESLNGLEVVGNKMNFQNEYDMNIYDCSLPKSISNKILAISKGSEMGIFTILLSALQFIIYKYTSSDNVLIGSPVLEKLTEIKKINDVIALRNKIRETFTYKEFIEQTKQTISKAYKHSAFPIERITDELELKNSENEIFRTIMLLDNIHSYNKNLKANTIFIFSYNNDAVDCKIRYKVPLFEEWMIKQIFEYFCKFLEIVLYEPEIMLSKVDLLSKSEKNKLLYEFNNTNTNYPKDKTIKELFEEQVEKTPESIALVCNNKELTYRELNDKSNQLARVLRVKGVKKDVFVGLMVEKSLEMIIGIMAILKAGGAYLPISSEYPEERIEHMIKDCKVKIVLTQKRFEDKLKFNVSVLNLEDMELYQGDNTNLEKVNDSRSLAYVIYTSGSTGNPKGVLVEHRNIVRLVKNASYISFESGDRILQTGEIVFDATTFELWGALLNGLSLFLVNKSVILDANKLGEFIHKERISILWLTSSLFNKLSEEKAEIFKTLKNLIIGGDVLSPKHVNRVMRKCKDVQIINGYGPTENTTFSTCHIIREEYKSNIPIGKPISNSKAYILDSNLNLQPIGVPGELCVGGDGVARGYLNLPELTAKKFIKNPYDSGDLIYRTGDLARWKCDGSIEFLGRIDDQVKIRGFRIELGEIENQLLDYSSIKEAVVIAKNEDSGMKYLCAYIVCEKDLEISDLRNFLSNKLPTYMIPSYFIKIDKIPLNSSGKVDKKALTKVENSAEMEDDYEKPANKIEEKLLAIWKEVLGVNNIGVNNNLFKIGGHSLKAITIASKIGKEFSVDIPIEEIFKNPTIRDIAEFINNSEKRMHFGIHAVEERPYYPLSSAQKRLFVLNNVEGNGCAYNIPLVMEVTGNVVRKSFEGAIKALVSRHESLRTSFKFVDGNLVQIISKDIEPNIMYIEAKANEVEEIINKLIYPFDLSKAPLLRAGLIKVSEERYIIFIDIHHIVSDGLSTNILLREFNDLYEGKQLPELEIQYKDYAVWQSESINSEHIKKQEEYWERVFADEIPVLELPTDYSRPAVQNFEGDIVEFNIEKELLDDIKNLALKSGATVFMIFMAAYNIFLHKHTGQEDIVVGTPISGRNNDDVKDVVGMFVNTLAMRNYPKSNKRFDIFLKEVISNCLNGYENQDFQFEELANKLNITKSPGRNPIFDTMLLINTNGRGKDNNRNLKLKPYNFQNKVAKFDMIFDMNVDENESCYIEYCTKLFKKETIERYGERFLEILKQITANPKIKIDEINILSQKEMKDILLKSEGELLVYPNEMTIQEYFEEQVEKTPENIAVVYKNEKLTYRELNEKSNQVARVLREKGVKADTIVGVMLERSLNMIIAIMAIVKAGGAYLPIPPEYPEDRIEYMIEDSKTNILVSQVKYTKRIKFDGIVIDVEDKGLYSGDKNNLDKINNLNNLIYVIYTSGSTGNPKGVMIEHRSTVSLLLKLQKKFPLKEADAYILKTNYAFDVSVTEIFGWLFQGGKLIILEKDAEVNIKKILDTIKKNGVTHINFAPSMLRIFTNYVSEEGVKTLKKLKYMFSAGEAISENLVQDVLNLNCNFKFVNLYGPTEATIYATQYSLINRTYGNGISIGKPLANTKIYIIGENNKLQPVGVVGELCIAGDGLARGYLNKSELTEDKFVTNPFEPREKMYKTGDLARWLPDGNIEYIGRIDHQVKIRGFRIELGEIESALLKNKEIKEAVVLDKLGERGNKYLCAFIVGEKQMIVHKLRESLSRRLPEYMLPSCFVQIEKMPLTPSGKVNRKVLSSLNENVNININSEYERPRTPVEEHLVSIWEEILGVKNIGINNNFFESGGHSLNAIVLMNRISQELNVQVTLTDIFMAPTIKNLAEELRLNEKIQTLLDENLVLLRKNDNAFENLFLIHDGSGRVESYIELCKRLELNVNCWGIRLNLFSGENCLEPRDITVEELAKQYIEKIKLVQPRGPYYIGGWSNGGTIAYEITNQLEKMGEKIDFLGIVDSNPPQKELNKSFYKFTTDSEKIFLLKSFSDSVLSSSIKKMNTIKEIYKTLHEVIESRDISVNSIGLDYYREIIHNIPSYKEMSIKEIIRLINDTRTIVSACANYVPNRAIDTEISYFKASTSTNVDESVWNEYCCIKLKKYIICGSHYTLFREPDVTELGESFNWVLKRLKNMEISYNN